MPMLQLEITGRCQAECLHCYADSSPSGTNGSMSDEDWTAVIRQARAAGFERVQFIGGEPTLHRSLPLFIDTAVAAGLTVEVYTNLVTMPERMWQLFHDAGVRLATSYYSDDPDEHRRITRIDSHARITANIREAVRRGLPLRVGLIRLDDGQRIAEAKALLASMGVTDVSVDRMRHLGRAETPGVDRTGELCGRCGVTVAAVLPDGRVTGCPMSRHLASGDVRTVGLSAALEAFAPHRALIAGTLHACQPPCDPWSLCDPGGDGKCEPVVGCDPSVCGPDGNADARLALTARPGCKPDSDGNDCSPAETEWEPDE